MNRHVKIDTVEITGPDGQRQDYLAQKTMLFISADANGTLDVRPEPRPGEKSWQIQAIARSGNCLLANVGQKSIQFQSLRNGSENSQLEAKPKICVPGSVSPVPYGQPIALDGAVITFHRRRVSESLAVDFLLPEPKLRPTHTPDTPLEGLITLSNRGSQTHVQFHVTVQAAGLPDGACHVEAPHPRLAFTRHRTLRFFIYHPAGVRPLPAGSYCLELQLQANEYPGETAADFQEVDICPFYAYDLQLTSLSPCSQEMTYDDAPD